MFLSGLCFIRGCLNALQQNVPLPGPILGRCYGCGSHRSDGLSSGGSEQVMSQEQLEGVLSYRGGHHSVFCHLPGTAVSPS